MSQIAEVAQPSFVGVSYVNIQEKLDREWIFWGFYFFLMSHDAMNRFLKNEITVFFIKKQLRFLA